MFLGKYCKKSGGTPSWQTEFCFLLWLFSLACVLMPCLVVLPFLITPDGKLFFTSVLFDSPQKLPVGMLLLLYVPNIFVHFVCWATAMEAITIFGTYIYITVFVLEEIR
jgi:hypothetical protein